MKGVAVSGYKNSGKTTLCLALARECKSRGATVAVAKFSGCGFDEREGADTARYKQVADTVLGLSDAESFVSWTGAKDLRDLLPMVEADVLLVEGGRNLDMLPRILVARDGLDKDGLAGLGPDLALAACGTDVPGVKRVDGVAALADLVEERGFLLQGTDCGACGRKSCRELAAAIVEGEASPEDCPPAHAPVSVTVNDRALRLDDATARTLAEAVSDTLPELKRFESGKAVIRLELTEKD